MKPVHETGRVPPVYSGVGQLCQLDHLIGAARDVLLVCDAGIAGTGLPDRVREAVEAHVAIRPFVAPNGEPDMETVNAAARAARAVESPVIIGLGGGTALDIAKLAAGLRGADTGVETFLLGSATITRDTARLIAIPTTSGTGSEVTRTCILSDGAGRKSWVWSEALTPDAVILDPALTTSLPRQVTLSTGLDAFAHALEACTGQARNRINEACALQAIRLIRGAMERVLSDPADLDARQCMQEAALLGGVAIDSGGTGIAHTIGHALGSLYHVPHGIAVVLGLQASLRWSVSADPDRYRTVAGQFRHGLSATELAEAFDHWLERLDFANAVSAAVSQPPDPAQLSAAMQAEENRPMAVNNARIPTEADMHMLATNTRKLWMTCTERAAAAS